MDKTYLDEIKIYNNFQLDAYLLKIIQIINKMFKNMKFCKKIQKDILDSEIDEKYLLISKIVKRKQMFYGLLWQTIIGNYDSFQDLKQNHYSGCDLFSRNRKIIIELKNRYNTDNSSSRHYNYSKLAKFKKNNKTFTCIYGIINPKKDFNNGQIKKIIHNYQEIYVYSGNKLFELIFGENYKTILNYVKLTVRELNNFSLKL